MKTSSRLLGQQGQLICARIFLCSLILLMRWVWWKFMKIVVGVVWPWTTGGLSPDYSSGSCGNYMQMQTAPLLTPKCPWPQKWPKADNQRRLQRWRNFVANLESPHMSRLIRQHQWLQIRQIDGHRRADILCEIAQKIGVTWVSECWGFVPYC